MGRRHSLPSRREKRPKRWVFTSEERALVVLSAATTQLQVLEAMGASLAALDENGRVMRAIMKIARRAREEILQEQGQQDDDAEANPAAPPPT